MTLLLEGRALDLAKKAALLDALSPLRILARGYAVVQSSEGKALMSMRHLNEGDQVELCMKDGRASIKILDTALS